MTEDLKPCPFCGSEDSAMFSQDVDPYNVYTDLRYFVKCKCCGCRSKKCRTEEKATAKWNRRV